MALVATVYRDELQPFGAKRKRVKGDLGEVQFLIKESPLAMRAVLAAEKANPGRSQTESAQHIGFGNVAEARYFDGEDSGREGERSSARLFERAPSLLAAVKQDY